MRSITQLRLSPNWRNPIPVQRNLNGFALLLMGALWCFVFVPMAILAVQLLLEGYYQLFPFVFLTAPGFMLLGLGQYARLRNGYIRAKTLVLDPWPGVINGTLAGFVDVKAQGIDDGVLVTLQCLHAIVPHKKSEVEPQVIWQWSQHGEIEHLARGRRVKFQFDVPDGMPESEFLVKNRYYWLLGIEYMRRGRSIVQVYEVPVFRTDALTGIDSAQASVTVATAA